ncbi:NAD-dependent protein deacetylase [Paenibacillus plantiphilus]|uniref:protein acetyllysine N-acetyltransferase n=1 Tax=Paenibacillus plantiphilus TaxID=2905650 RepID=A0ABM9C508_9BACL|nr:NAD-dependent protein deacylase [Paenibacillus plantiphilus]CAH1202714.1 NAD-dependent protein deacetylase [Paenibacillus plantiphilus]
MDFQQLKAIVNNSENIVFFGGAGVSTESGIPDYRSGKAYIDGNSVLPEEVLSKSCLAGESERFFQYYRKYLLHPNAKPNDAHLALVELENRTKLEAIITQNVDGLHQQAGSKQVIELHGSTRQNYCMVCGEKYDLQFVLNSRQNIPRCQLCAGIVRPNITLYEEDLDSGVIQIAKNLIATSEILVIAGTSLSVYPAAGLLKYYRGECMIIINETPTRYDGLANYIISDRVGKVMKSLII